MSSRNQGLGLNRVIVESAPLLEAVTGKIIILLRVPGQQRRIIRDTHAGAESLDGRRRSIQHIIRIDQADLMNGLLGAAMLDLDIRSCRHARSDKPLANEVVKVSSELAVPGLGGVVVVESRDVIQRRNGAAIIRGHAVVRITDEERKVEAFLNLARYHRRVSRLSRSIVGVWPS